MCRSLHPMPDMVVNHNVLNGFPDLVPQDNRSGRKVEFIECDPIEITAVSRLAVAGKIDSVAIHYILLPSKVNKLRLMKGKPTNYAKNILIKPKKYLTNRSVTAIIRRLLGAANRIWGYSSAGRALEWHSRGQRFDPAYLHQKPSKSSDFGGFYYFTAKKCGILPRFPELPDTYLTTNWTI